MLFRGVEVPPGRRKVVFRFAPFSFGNLASALASALRPANRSRYSLISLSSLALFSRQ